MRMHAVVTACVVALLACGIAPAQEAFDITAAGESMKDVAAQGDLAAAYEQAREIVAAQPEDLTTVSADERYWIGLAHAYLMAEAFEAAVDELEGEQAELAARMREMLLGPGVEPVRTVAFGERIDLADYLVPGQTVVVDFYSDFCPPCVAIAPHLKKLAEQRDDILVLKVDINRPGVRGIDWQSPVAQQYGIRGVPYFKVFGPDGEIVADGAPARDMVLEWLGELED
jgi:thiol-disulfide isomerase/thioredoxin